MSRIDLGTQPWLSTAGRGGAKGGRAQGAGMKHYRMKGLFREHGSSLQSLLRWEAELSTRKVSMVVI